VGPTAVIDRLKGSLRPTTSSLAATEGQLLHSIQMLYDYCPLMVIVVMKTPSQMS
jgi:hypothetical protein